MRCERSQLISRRSISFSFCLQLFSLRSELLLHPVVLQLYLRDMGHKTRRRLG
jgi:hypothetical protein